jgi:hypothetical protein
VNTAQGERQGYDSINVCVADRRRDPALKILGDGKKIEGERLLPGLSRLRRLRHILFARGPEPPKTPSGHFLARCARQRPVVRPPVPGRRSERVAQCLRAARWPGFSFIQRSEIKAGPLHWPAALRASASECSALAPRLVAPLCRAPLVQSARGRALIQTSGIFTLRGRFRFSRSFR